MSSDVVWGYSWRSSTPFVILTIVVALFSETFLYGFIVPILPWTLQFRMRVHPSSIQRITYIILLMYGAVGIVSGPIIGHFADKMSSRRAPLLAALGVAVLGTALVATASGTAGLIVGRAIQSIGGTAAWIIGFATLRDTIETEHMGKTFGLVNGLVAAGTILGPATAGILLEQVGYWLTWLVAILVLVIDVLLRLIMIENPRRNRKPALDRKITNGRPRPGDSTNTAPLEGEAEAGEETRLTSDSPLDIYGSRAVTSEDDHGDTSRKDGSTAKFYGIILSQRRVVVALICYTYFSSLITSFDTTLPIHVKESFGWGSMPAGILFLAVEGPALVLSPFFGWVRDKVGMRILAIIGFATMIPSLWFVGAADQQKFPWAQHEKQAKVTYVISVLSFGCFQNLLVNLGSIEITRAVDELETREPGVFGPNGGYSRGYALSNLSFMSGMLIGPLLSGILVDHFSYFVMNTVLACLSSVMCFLVIVFLRGDLSHGHSQDKATSIRQEATSV